MGHGSPNNILGITTTFTYKGFTLNAVAEYRGGNVIENAIGNNIDFAGLSQHSAQNGRQDFVVPNSVIVIAPGDTVPNTNVIVRNAGRLLWTSSPFPSTQSTYLTSAAFWKLREVSLTFDVPVKNILGGAIKAAQVGIVGRNLIMLRPSSNVWTDPEFNNETGTSNAVGNTNIYQTPPTRIYGFSIKLTF
jgi:hypothetical protein